MSNFDKKGGRFKMLLRVTNLKKYNLNITNMSHNDDVNRIFQMWKRQFFGVFESMLLYCYGAIF